MKGGPFGDIRKIFEKSHSAEKCKKEHSFGFINIHCVANYQKLEGRTFRDMNKNFEENSHSVEKIERGPLVSSGFLGYVKVNTEGGALCTEFALSIPGLSGFRSFSKKWTDQSEVCSLKKQDGNV